MRAKKRHSTLNEKMFCVLTMIGICFLCKLIFGLTSVSDMLLTIILSVVGSIGLTAKVFNW